MEEALERERRLNEETKKAQERMMSLQRAGVVGQVSGLLAHELNQPLGSLNLYARSLIRAADLGNLTKEKLLEVLEEIRRESFKASEIVQRVRSYAKGEKSERTDIFLGDFSSCVVNNYLRHSSYSIEVKYLQTANPVISANKLEMELVLINLIRNAQYSLNNLKTKQPLITVDIRKVDCDAQIVVEDNGSISDELLNSLSQPLNSSKREGLGLGLSIVKAIVENHSGSIRFSKSKLGGLKITIQIPTFKDGKTYEN